MARFVSGASAAAFGQGLFGSLKSSTMDYLKNELGRISSGGSFRQDLYNRSVKIFDNISSSSAIQFADAILMQAESGMGQDIIETLTTVRDLQCARPQMQYWIMEDERIYSKWKKGIIDGYSDTYVDPEPGFVGEERTSYQTLMHGVFREHETQAWTMSLFSGRETDDTMNLSITRMAAIFDSRNAAYDHLENGEDDVTSQYGAKL